ncbi:ATP-binding cassette domain-containing protein [Pseudomonas kairouanensis]|uniref:ATP-binding cassette domain-containing protein n=1 Tax=Pseudomonas kairouanensis TaxID=2293832 RepID=A0A4Z0AUW6_9PSED|nr:ATP-binding cassette domain-containing protein [Pseudomonas kairouanensis]TFY90485.1 ATP-binding cassette domain-containing protein [Pseudomonas kairouanensis]
MLTLIKKAFTNHAKLLIATVVTTIALKLLVLAPPLLLGRLVDTLSSNASFSKTTLLSLVAAFILAGCVQTIANPLQTYLLSRLVQRILMEASIGWIGQLLRKEFDIFNSWRIGHFIKSVERGLTAHEKLLTFFITTALPLCLEFLVTAGAFLMMGGVEIFLILNGLAVSYALVTYHIIRWRRKHLDAVNAQEDELSGILFNTLNAGKTIKLENAEHSACHPLNLAFKHYADTAITVARSGGYLSGAKIFFLSLSTGALLGWGVFDQLSVTPSISVGQLVAIFSIASSYLINITTLIDGYRALDQFLADQRRLKYLLQSPNFNAKERNATLPTRSNFTLTLGPCSLMDNDAHRITVGKTLAFTQHQSVAITGPSGSGKSTLLELLAGLNQQLRSQLYINDLAVSALDARIHLNCLRYCPQSPQFLEGIFDHSVLFGTDRSEDLQLAIRTLNLETLIASRSLSEKAGNVSGGEAKRLSLLRLINRPGNFNLFDEPSASIEQTLAGPVWDLLFKIFANRGLICVTHDLRNLERFDRVIVMQEGKIVDDGPWHVLVGKPAIKALLEVLQPKE